jgi:hypothetical protein
MKGKRQSPRSRETFNSSCTTLLQGVSTIGTERAMKSFGKTLHEPTTHVPKESTEGDTRCRPPYKLR